MPKLLVITGPSGVGKTYLAEHLIQLYPDMFESVKLFSTRQPRPGERLTDRTFITPEEFAAKHTRGEIILEGRFHGHRYGYPATLLQPGSKHSIVNAWPSFVPKLSDLPDVVVVGLNIDQDSLPLLLKRMQQRGDSPAQIDERQSIIRRDMRQLEQLQSVINQQGRIFTIEDDQTIPKFVIPWLLTAVG